ncbi:MAG: peptide chain release factor N(5)-glutamine methyltransferase [Planctomycetota bacterium]
MIARQEGGSFRSSRWSIGDLLRWTEEHFRKLGLDSPRLDAEILLAKALSATRLQLYTEYHKLAQPEERARFRELILRRAQREPVAYIVGAREFHSLSFFVNPSVLIPRPETEHLVDWALEELEARAVARPGDELRVLDLGTGSGNIGVAIAVRRPGCLVDAVDVSREALEVARANADAHGVSGKVRFLEGDWFGAVPDGARYALVVSNPPYVSPAEFERLAPEIRLHEPRLALVGSEKPDGDGLESYRIFATRGAAFLADGGALGVEVAAGKAREVEEIFAASGWTLRRKVRDYGGIDRVLAFARP